MAKFESLTRLYDSVRASSHDFRITTDPFPPLDPEKLAKSMEIERKAAENGKANIPAGNGRELDEVERAIVERVESQRDDAFQILEEQLDTYATRLRNLDFDGHFSQIEMTNHSSVEDFQADVTKGRDELFIRRNDLKATDEELEDFRKRNGLEKRIARVRGSLETWLKVLFVALLLIVETVVNGIYLAKGNDSGLVGGIGYAFGFAFVNVIGTFLLALFGIRQLNRRSFTLKIIGFISLLLWIALAIALNLAMAHYREISASAVDNIGLLVRQRLSSDPLGLADIDSFVLFAGGVLFSIAALLDGLFMTDPYPGYAGTYQRYVNARDDYAAEREHRVEGLKDIRDDHNEKIEGIIQGLSKRRKECAAIIDARTRMTKLFGEHQTQLESVARKLLAIYREENRAARKEEEPKHFKVQYKMERRKVIIDTSDDWSDKDLSERIQTAQAELSAQMKRISKAFEDAVSAYHELDHIYSETINGSPA
ncbi:YIP1 family protein [Rhizobium leguminosarum]|uniref:hypothetical protein n=1 Tax=Rhizobium leguminosarum TaxID=384 RepID=UPI001C940FFC|nr:hypothetical protein [Rhizobium leguminosarum]MBY5774217.1 YIP1 family protein [Rhizobium leguminosarum]